MYQFTLRPPKRSHEGDIESDEGDDEGNVESGELWTWFLKLLVIILFLPICQICIFVYLPERTREYVCMYGPPQKKFN